MTGVLAIDTASDEIAIAFGRGREAPRTLCRDGERNHSQLLLAMIDEVVAQDRASISSIIVVRGPGSYAGLRVGIATAQGLGLALGVPVAGIGTLEAAYAASGEAGHAYAIHPAGRGEYAVQEFRAGEPIARPRAVSKDDLPQGLLAGEGADGRGGRHVGAAERCLAALARGQTRQAGPAEALYLREPSITLSRRGAGTGAG